MTKPIKTFSIKYTDAGFTDQIAQCCALYKLGTSLGLDYQHTPLFSPRSMAVSSLLGFYLWKIARKKPDMAQRILKNSTRDIYNFLGTNTLLRTHSQPTTTPPKHTCTIILSDDILNKKAIQSFTALQKYIREKMASTQNPPFDHLLLKIQNKRLFTQWIHEAIPNKPSTLNFLEAYKKQRQKDAWKATFNKGKIKTVIHIRQGDTATINTPWGTWISLNVPPKSLKQSSSLREADNSPPLPCDAYASILQHMIESEPPHTFSTHVYSDGFRHAYNKLLLHKKRIPLNLKQSYQLRKARKTCDTLPFQPFRTLPNTQLHIGEDNAKLRHLIDSVIQADLLIINTKQYMLPKLIANYRTDENMPLILVLHSNKNPPNLHLTRLGISPKKQANFIYLRYPCPDLPSFFTTFKKKLHENQNKRKNAL